MTDLASKIDHTLLTAEAGRRDIHKLVADATRFHFATVCVNGRFVGDVAKALSGTGVKTCAVVGFPLGAAKPAIKAIEATSAAKDGADEIDVVAHLPALMAGDVTAAKQEMLEVVRAARAANPHVVIKLIIESALLMHNAADGLAESRIANACRAARESGCDYVKTSTGYHPAGGASAEAVRLMHQHAAGLKVKASGGIRSHQDATRMIDAGADRIGCSSSIAIMSEARATTTRDG